MHKLALAAALAALLAAPTALAGGPRMELGSVLDEAEQPTLAAAATRIELAKASALRQAIRFSVTWSRGQTGPDPETLTDLQNAVAAAHAADGDVYVIAYPYGSSQTPLSATDQADFVAWLASLARALPDVGHFIVGNEPNLNRFWMPQFGPSGEDVAAPAYEALLAKAYDALKAVRPTISVVGGALAHAGVDKPHTGRDTHSPTAFIEDMGAAYRASGRTKPIMDEFAMHPYMLDSSEPPTLTHPHDTTITIADYWKLVPLLEKAFDGTAQKGSTLPIVYDEFGVENEVPPSEQSLFFGSEPASVHPVDFATQERYYHEAIALAFCQPNVHAFMIFRLIDEPDLAGWQSGPYLPNLQRKPTFGALRASTRQAQRNVIAHCSWLHVTPKVTAAFFPDGQPATGPSRFPVALTCDVDCKWTLTLERLPGGGATARANGTAIGDLGERVELPKAIRVAPGSYRLVLTAAATENAGAPRTATSASFTIARG